MVKLLTAFQHTVRGRKKSTLRNTQGILHNRIDGSALFVVLY